LDTTAIQTHTLIMAKFTSYNLAICLVVSTGGFSYGFGAANFVTSIGQPEFYAYFNLDPGSIRSSSLVTSQTNSPSFALQLQNLTLTQTSSIGTANILSAANALFFFGCAAGSLTQCFLSDWLGRRDALGVAGLLALVGNALVAGSVNVPMLIVARVLQGGGLGMLLALVPLYLTEVSPPKIRGFLTGLTTLSFGTGYVV
jgi:MFS family permease